jgi:hypothetical protein
LSRVTGVITAGRLPLNYPPINQFPEWFVAESARLYVVRDLAAQSARTVTGHRMHDGLALELKPGVELRWRVQPVQN